MFDHYIALQDLTIRTLSRTDAFEQWKEGGRQTWDIYYINHSLRAVDRDDPAHLKGMVPILRADWLPSSLFSRARYTVAFLNDAGDETGRLIESHNKRVLFSRVIKIWNMIARTKLLTPERDYSHEVQNSTLSDQEQKFRATVCTRLYLKYGIYWVDKGGSDADILEARSNYFSPFDFADRWAEKKGFKEINTAKPSIPATKVKRFQWGMGNKKSVV